MGALGLEPSPMSREAVTTAAQPGAVLSAVASGSVEDSSILGSPMKRHRPSISGPPERSAAVPGLGGLDGMLSGGGSTPPTKTTFTAGGTAGSNAMDEEEL